MMQLKPEVIFDITPELSLALGTIETVFIRYGLPLIITSARDGQHKQGSLHYTGNAVDFRSKGIPASVKQAIYSWLKTNLSHNYEIYFEFPGQVNEHFHIEYDPKPQYVTGGLPFLPVQTRVHEPETYDSEAGLIPVEAPLPGGYNYPIISGEIFSQDSLIVALSVFVLLWLTIK